MAKALRPIVIYIIIDTTIIIPDKCPQTLQDQKVHSSYDQKGFHKHWNVSKS